MELSGLEKIEKLSKEIKNRIVEYDFIKVITHHDTDGLSSGTILTKTLFRANKTFQVKVVEHLSRNVIDKLVSKDNSLYIFADMGSGQIHDILEKEVDAIILDHHPPEIEEEFIDNIVQLNPHLYGFDGAKEITASGTCYFVAREFGYYDLSQMAIVGMIGDMQFPPMGLNKFIVNEAREKRYIKIFNDIIYNIYGVEIYKAMAYCTKPYIEDLNSEAKAEKFLLNLKIDPKKKDLSKEEYKKIISHLIFKYPEEAEKLIIERVLLRHKVRDAHLLSEMLNAVGRHGYFSIGIGIGLEDDECIRIGNKVLWDYKKALLSEIKRVELKSLRNIKYFEGRKGYIGIVAGILAKEKPVIGYYIEGDVAKFSARGNKKLVDRGLNLSKVMSIAKEFGGTGGGHNIASGAMVPKEKVKEFLERVDELIGEQLRASS
ncbi:phosphoesterase RecJ domain protein [Methanocaldococcus infernus ME]|uniref:Phosphoesterase RecJ domain protein n=1 Tax=Methanocaldococcus infernus (strain DSM 11812 / JCM 15783 / ME) TaxID=573063 RepID=D5VU73_METIM|nr:DHH family phosphoesterase [Methanocaldococcus infernus]ADG12685.1 phosphoesterase RecJ domain protein [Methanocaldococcus infernus ME]